MSTVSATRKSSKSRVKSTGKTELVVSLALAINHQVYTVTPIVSQDEEVFHAWHLVKKSDGAAYDVAETFYGATCDCPSHTFNHDGLDDVGCKHIQALRACGMLMQPHCDRRPPDHWSFDPNYVPLRHRPEEAAITIAPAADPSPAPCCAPAEATPCIKCVAAAEVVAPALDVAEPAIAEAAPAEIDPNDVECDPADWPAWTDSWFATPTELEPEPEPEPDPEPELFEPFEPSAEDWAEAEAAFAEMDAQRHLDHSERLTLAELVDRQTDFYRGWGNAAGEMIARAMDELALKIRMTESTTPAELETRAEMLEQDIRHQWMDVGYDTGRDVGRGELTQSGSAFGHSA